MDKTTQLGIAMTERLSAFCQKIDRKFPYDDIEESTKLIHEAFTISSEAVFMIVHELARLPANAPEFKSERLSMILIIKEKLNHPLANDVLEVARKMICSEAIAEQETIDKIKVIGNYPGNYNALNTIYFSNWSEEVDSTYELIRSTWEEN